MTFAIFVTQKSHKLLFRLLFRIRDLKIKLETQMRQIFYDSTIEEWIETHVNPILKKLEKIVTNADQQLVIHVKADQIIGHQN